MPLPTGMQDLSTTAASNSPAGGDPVGTSLDNYLREIQAIIRHTNAKGADIASAATTNIAAATGEFVTVTGTTTITALGTIDAGIVRVVHFSGALTITHNATSLILPGAQNYVTAAGDVLAFRSLGSGNWRCVGVTRASSGIPTPITVATVATMKALTGLANGARVQPSGYYVANDYALPVWIYDSSSTATDDGGSVIAPDSGTGRFLLPNIGYDDVKWYGAKGDGVAADATPILAAVARRKALGGFVLFPAGKYIYSSSLTVDETGVTSESDLTRIALVGHGSGNTELNFTGTTQAINYAGGTGGGLSAYVNIRGMRIQGNGLGSANGLVVDNAAFWYMQDVVITGFTTGKGISGTDILSCLFESCRIRANKYGGLIERIDQSYPNAITLVDTDVGLNVEYGLYVKRPTTFNTQGGSFQGNGLTGVEATKFGLKMDSGGAEGAVACQIDGTYFELNKGDADVLIEHTTGDCSYNFDGATFNRISSADYVTNNIKLSISGGKALVNTKGCGFKGFDTYVEDTTRKYIAFAESGGTANWTDQGSLFNATVARPAITGPVRTGNAMASAFIRFDGVTPATTQSFNAALTKNGTGDYTITYDKAMTTAANTYAFALSVVGFVEIFSETTTTVRIITKNLGGAATDFAVVCVTVFGGSEIV